MTRTRLGLFLPALLLPGLLLGLLSACDTVEPESAGVLVVEGFLDAGKPPPDLLLRQTQPLSAPYDTALAAVEEAVVELTVDGQRLAYLPDPARPGRFRAPTGAPVPGGAAFALAVRWAGGEASAAGVVPPPVRIADVRVTAPDRPVLAVLLDSLLLRPVVLDSLRFDSLGTGAERGYVYPVEVSVTWADNLAPADSAYWIRAQLRPDGDVAAGILAFFLRPEQVVREARLARDGDRRRWTGVYAVPVATPQTPLPPHQLKVSLVRSGTDYARFATSRDAPGRREPRSNVTGGTGIVVGVSVDSVRVDVPATTSRALHLLSFITGPDRSHRP